MHYTRPMFLNPTGYTMRMVCGSSEMFEYTADPVNPLTYWDLNGGDWQPDRHFFTDRGSIPACVSWLPGFGRNRLAYLFHDSAYSLVEGRGHGLYYRGPADLEFTWRPLAMREADDLMHAMLLAEGVRPWAARTIWAAVRTFGRRW
jgi:hypothetical protein